MDERKAHWEHVYSEKSPLEVSWYQGKPELSLEMIDHAGIDKSGAVIDIGGGASTLVDYLLDAGYSNLSVLDISAGALTYAQQRLAERAKTVQWLITDITDFNPPARYALWHDRAVFHFLTETADRQSYVSVLRRSLQSGGHLIMAAFAIGGPTKCSGLDIVQYDAEKLGQELGPEFELVEERAERHQTPDGREQKFGYFRFVFRPSSR